MTELDKYELKPGGYYAIKFPDNWSVGQVSDYLKMLRRKFNEENMPNIIPLFNGMKLVNVKEVEND